MADLNETNEWPEGIYQIETTDPVIAGTPNVATGAGMSNIPHLQLAKRTAWLKVRVDQLIAAVVPATTVVAGIVRLSSAVDSTAVDRAATPAAVKAANDNANDRVPTSRTISASGLASGGGDGTANRTIDVPVASQAEAEAGASNTKAMTPMRVAQAIAATVVAASTTVAGIVRLSSSVNSTSTALAATPAAVKAANDNANGRVPNDRSISTAGLASGGGSLAADRTVDVPAASDAEAEGAALRTKAMTPAATQAAIARRVPGWGQTWVKPSRSIGTWYQNTTGRPITVMLTSSSGHRIHIGASTSSYIVHDESGSTVGALQASFIVPPAHYYRLMEASGANVDWCELR